MLPAEVPQTLGADGVMTGSGPVQLLSPGGAADADGFLPALEFLTPHYTVVRYDPRGISRSRLDDPAVDVPVEVHAADAQALLRRSAVSPPM